jgi:hypothetical protein
MASFMPAIDVLLRGPQTWMAGTRPSAGPVLMTEEAVSARYLPSGMRTPPQASRTW